MAGSEPSAAVQVDNEAESNSSSRPNRFEADTEKIGNVDMSCRNCEYFSPRGNYVKGRFVQNENSSGVKLGWCQFYPPTGAVCDENKKKIENNWPVVAETERCGQEKTKTAEYCYVDWYEDVLMANYKLRKQLENRKELHKAVGELGPLVGLKTSSVRLRIVAAVKKALIVNHKL